MRIALVAPPTLYRRSHLATGVLPPLGVGYLASSLIAQGHDVVVIDAVGEAPGRVTGEGHDTRRGLTFPEIMRRIPIETELVGVSSRYSSMAPLDMALLALLGRERPAATLVVGGPHASACSAEVLSERCVDFVVIGEGEDTLCELATTLAEGDDPKQVAGLAYRENGKVVRSPPRPPIVPLDRLPWPAWDLLPMQSHWDAREPHGASRGRWANVLATRGCPYDCSFCTSPTIEGRKQRRRDPADVVAEIRYLVETYDVNDIHFADDNLTVHRNWTESLARAILASGLDITWQLGTGVRVETLTRDLLDLLVRSGLRNLTLAPESGSPRVLREVMSKPIDLDAIRRVVSDAVELDLRVCLFFFLGAPGETRAEAEQTLDFAAELARLGADEASFGSFSPLPGSPLFTRLAAEGRVQLNDAFYNDLRFQAELVGARSWSDEMSAETLSALRRRAFRRFYLTSFLHHPNKAFRLFRNLVRGRQETKTDRVLQRLLGRHALPRI